MSPFVCQNKNGRAAEQEGRGVDCGTGLDARPGGCGGGGRGHRASGHVPA